MLAMVEVNLPAYVRDINQHEVLELVESIPRLGEFDQQSMRGVSLTSSPEKV